MVNNLKQSTCKGKQKTEIGVYIMQCQKKVVRCLLHREKATNEEKQSYRSIINSTLLRLKNRLETIEYTNAVEVNRERLSILLDIVQNELGNELVGNLAQNFAKTLSTTTTESNENAKDFLLRKTFPVSTKMTKYELMDYLLDP